MALVLADRVKETTTTTGTATYTLAGASTGFESFASIGDGNTTYYACTDGTDFEVGIGTYTASGTTLARTTILQSSNSDAAVSWSSGTKTIFCCQPAEKAVFLDASGNIAAFNGSNLTNVDAQTLDSLDSTQFLRSDQSDTMTGDLTLISTDAGATTDPALVLFRDSASPTAGDSIGSLGFHGNSSTDTERQYAFTRGSIVGATDGNEYGQLRMGVIKAGSISTAININAANNETRFQNFPVELDDVDLTIVSTDAGATENPSLILHRDSASPADFDVIGNIQFDAENSAGEQITYGNIKAQIVDQTDGTEDGYLRFTTIIGGGEQDHLRLGFSTADFYGNVRINPNAIVSDPALIFEGTTDNDFETFVKATDPTSDNIITLPDASGTVLLKDANDDVTIESTDAGSASDPQFIFFRNSPSPADNDAIGKFIFKGNNDAAQQVQYGSILSRIVDATDGTEDGSFELQTISEGSIATNLRIDASSLVGIRLLNGGERNIRFDTGTAFDNNHIDLTPASATGSRTITLPDATGTLPVFTTAPTGAIADGTNGQVLTTDGSGGLSFTTVSGGGGGSGGTGVAFTLYEYTATAGQTTFSGSDDNTATLAYTVDLIQVVVNGVILDPSDYTATNGTSIVLSTGATLNDVVNIYAYDGGITTGKAIAMAIVFGG